MKQRTFSHLSFTARIQIEAWLREKIPIKKIAQNLNVHISTIYREVKRGTYQKKISRYTSFLREKYYIFTETYSPDIAHKKYKDNLTAKGSHLKIGNDYEFANYIENKIIDEELSPAAVLGQIQHNGLKFNTSICVNTLYSYIRKGIFSRLSVNHLLNKGVVKLRKKKGEEKEAKRAPKGTSIELRPNDISKRNEFGHWEMDCVCGPTKDVVLNLTERMTRKIFIFKMPDQKAVSVVKILNLLESKYGSLFKRIFKTITVDNGSEFSAYDEMQKSIFDNGLRTKIYYCHPYHASERGSNERLNREIRRKIPKGSNLSKYSNEDIQHIEQWLNNYPRRILGYATSKELFDKQIALLG